MRVLLLGPNGQLGTDIQRVVEKETDIDILLVSRVELDVEQLDRIREVLSQYEFDALINCTSYHKTDEVEDNGSKAVTVNAHAVEHIANVCKEKNAKFIHISTDYVFSGEKLTPYSEDDYPAPVNVYGMTKFYGETLAQRACDKTYVLRVASLFGIAGASGKGGNFVETMIRLAKENGELKVVDDTRMSPTSTYTVAEVIVQILFKDIDAGVYHVVNSGDATWKEFAQIIVEYCGIDVPVYAVTSKEFSTRAHRPRDSVLDNSKIELAIDGRIGNWQSALAAYFDEKGYLPEASKIAPFSR